MPKTFVDALADSIVRQLLPDSGAETAVASRRGAARVGGGRRTDALAGLSPHAVTRVASAIAGQLAEPNGRSELPLEAIEI